MAKSQFRALARMPMVNDLLEPTGGDLNDIKERQAQIDALVKAQTADLCVAYVNGSNATELAKLIGSTKQQVAGLLKRNNVKMRPRGGLQRPRATVVVKLVCPECGSENIEENDPRPNEHTCRDCNAPIYETN